MLKKLISQDESPLKWGMHRGRVVSAHTKKIIVNESISEQQMTGVCISS